MNSLSRKLSVAPMMDWTDRHERAFLRAISKRTLLYTEMVTTGAILHGDHDRFLAFEAAEHPVALQLGGSEPEDLAASARAGAARGYDEINLNLGCPSDRVQRGRFGACLMTEPALVADCVAAMIDAVDVPVTVKTRIGVDEQDSYRDLTAFVEKVAATGCSSFTIHARKAWLSGLSPKENREVPPLRYDVVYDLKRDFPELEIVLNGGVQSLDEAEAHLEKVDGVMIGRAAYQSPYILAEADSRFFGAAAAPRSREEIVTDFLPYVERQLSDGVPLKSITRHMLGLFNGLPGARAWRRCLAEEAHKPGAGPEVIEEALARWRETRERQRAA
ncbi:tRNA dihydrouridine(20/20a) synthase DusA [Pelagibius marinus]|uniref:tRNA dihydrouridine(20/20a) synthase DusA n=1 Tax=Pelagibius marinus TaxID=2762760 RepID=UPI0018724F60|nr:tRNA dihydrouridine(20/20a) synthase DusA [Pelagibius marinus]